MKILVVEPQKVPYTKQIGSRLKDLKRAVGGEIEGICLWDENVALIVDANGKLKRQPLNRLLRDTDGSILDIIAGTCILCGINGGSFTDIPEDMIEKYSQKFKFLEVDF